MKVLFRNFIKLLSIGAFDSKDTTEPMSEYKWNQLLVLAEKCEVKEFVYTGILRTCGQCSTLIPQGIYEKAQTCKFTNKAVSSVIGNKTKYNLHKQVKKFANFYLNRKYNQIVFDEIHSIDTSVDSLVFLDKLVTNIDVLINAGLNFQQLFELGFYLRENGDKVDFVKIENWIKILKLNKMSSLIGYYLAFFFHFSDAELPFLKHSNKKNEKTALNILEVTLCSSAKPTMANGAGTHQSINPIAKPDAHPLKYFSYCPLETSSRFIANIIKSLSNIDE